MKSPQQELYDYVGYQSELMGYDTYDHLPMESENADYPFVQIGDINAVPLPNKSAISAELNLTVNVWGNQDQRLVIDTMANSLLMVVSKRFKTQDYRYQGMMAGSDVQMIQDTSIPDTVLNHAIVQMKFRLI
jgi:hypothetical protein